MSVTLGFGFAPYLLDQLKMITGEESLPQEKLEPDGTLTMLQNQQKPEILQLNTGAGHRKTVQIRYKQRYTKDYTGTNEADVCNNALFEPRREMSVELSSFRFIPLYLEDEMVARYEESASAALAAGQPATEIMQEMLGEIMRSASALYDAVNTDLLTLLSGSIGVNWRTGNNSFSNINLSKDGTKVPLTDGMTQILSDYKTNGGKGTPWVIGDGGLFHNFMMQQPAKSYNQGGLNTAVEAAGVKFYLDLNATSALGANKIIVGQPNSVQIVEYMRYTGFKAGRRPGASTFGTMNLPMQVGFDIVPVAFDFQLIYQDCTTVLNDMYYGEPIELQPGFNLILSKKTGLFTIPADAYRPGDRLFGNRGTLAYNITNNCDVC